jgi:histidinol-phosphatase (PHP family)
MPQLILSLGGRLCLSDDSHGTAFVGLNYAKMRDYLVGAGVKEVYYLVPAAEKQGGDLVVGHRGRVVARRSDDWATDPFWEVLHKANEEKQLHNL